MRIKFGDTAFDVTLKVDPSKRLLELTQKDLEDAEITITRIGGVVPLAAASQSISRTEQPTSLFQILSQSGFTPDTLVRIARKVLNVNMRVAEVEDKFSTLAKAASGFLERDLKREEIWALFIRPVAGKHSDYLMAVGINSKEQLIVLGKAEGKPKAFCKHLIARGLSAADIKFLMLSNSLGDPEEILELFPKAKLARDWSEYAALEQNPEHQEYIKMASLTPDENLAKAAVKRLKLPAELLTYYGFGRDYWRSLRSAYSIQKIEREIRSRTHKTDPKETVDALTLWTLLRIQYQWLKVPVTAHELKNLASVRPHIEVTE